MSATARPPASLPVPPSRRSRASAAATPVGPALTAKRLRSILAALRLANAQLRVYEKDNAWLLEQNRELKLRLDKSIDLSFESPAFKGGLGGRTAVEAYRNTNVGKFIQHVNNVGDIALTRGAAIAEFALKTMVKADFECLFAAPPASVEEGERRARCEVALSNPARLRILSGAEEWNERARQDFIADVLSAGVDSSTHELVRRSAEVLEGRSRTERRGDEG